MPIKTNIQFEKITSGYLLLMLSFFLLYTGTGGYESITESKFFLFKILTGFYLAIMLLIFIELIVIGQIKMIPPKSIWKNLSLAEKLLLFYLLWTLFSSLFAVDNSVAFLGGSRDEGFLTILLYCIPFFFISRFAKHKKLYLIIFSISISICCIIALIQIAGFNPFNLYPDGLTYNDAGTMYSGEYLGTIGNADLMASMLCLSIGILWASFWKISGKLRFLILVPMLLCLATIVLSKVDAGYVGVATGIWLTVPIVFGTTKKRKLILFFIVLFILILAFFIVFFFGGQLPGFLNEAYEILHGNFDNSFGSGRIFIWKSCIDLLPDRLLIGGGPDTLYLRLDAQFMRYDENLGMYLRSNVDVAHNEYLNILMNQGLIGLLLYIAFITVCAVHWIKNQHNKTTVICGCAVLFYCLQAFFGFSSVMTTPYLWIALSLLFSREDLKV